MTLEQKVGAFLRAKEGATLPESMLEHMERESLEEVVRLANAELAELNGRDWMPVSVGAFRARFANYMGYYIELAMSDLRFPDGDAVPDEYFSSWPAFVAKAKEFLASRLRLPSWLRLAVTIDLCYTRDDGDNQ